MAKEIRPIQCPQCGATQKVEIKADYYKCTNCDTEYFLDNDDITITHNVNYNYGSGAQVPIKRTGLVFGVLLLIVIFGTLLVFWVSSASPEPSNQSLLNKNFEKTKTVYTWKERDAVAFAGENGQPILLNFGQLDIVTGEDASKSGVYAVFCDFLSGKELKSQYFDMPKANGKNFKFETFVNGDVYAIVDGVSLFKVNKEDISLQPVDASFKEHPELSAGIADFDFLNDHYGDGIKLLTNDGKNYTYFPIADLVYNQEQVRQAERDLTAREPKAKTRTYFDFSSKSLSFPEEKIQLYKWTQKDNLGGPNNWTYFEWRTYYDGRGVSKKMPYRGTGDLIIAYEDLTPDRLYFSPKVLFSDDDYVLISMNTTAGANANVALQCLNAKTGKIVFTYNFKESVYFKENAIRYKKGFVAFTTMIAVAIDMDGKLIKEIKIM